MTDKNVEQIMKFAGLIPNSGIKGYYVWDKTVDIYANDTPNNLISSLVFIKQVEDKMIKEGVEKIIKKCGLTKEPEIKTLIHTVSNNHVIKIHEVYDRGSRIFISSGSGSTENEAAINAILDDINNKEKL